MILIVFGLTETLVQKLPEYLMAHIAVQ